MMLVLALRSNPESVYEKALAYFTPEELSEAFAATRGVASPSQLRASMKADGRGLLETFRELAPPRKPIAIQRWSIRRVAAHRHHAVPAVADRVDRHRAVHPLTGGRDICGLRHRPDHAADGTGGPDGDQASVRRRPAAWGGARPTPTTVVRDKASFTVAIGSDQIEPGHRDADRDLPGRHRGPGDPDRRRLRHLPGATRHRARHGARPSTMASRSSTAASWSPPSSRTRI